MSALETLMDKIDEVTEPSKMTKPQALEFLRDLIGEIEMRCEALREEIKNEE